ncbi:MAG: hypothetical protein GYA55_09935 [SAR324 cluster bacterium]|uniref:Uncharacterized protein n=1 Tax=SAR324 cluster bacterium TaxID=2024889 RepID=A0A7X9FSF5_9DELT|nr:hypothetical protein [SAR324 cluster bacterium]
MNPLPTPFDIAAIPYFAPDPGLGLWVGVLTFFTIISALAFVPRESKRRAHTYAPSPFHDAEELLEKLINSKTLKKNDLFDLTHRLKAIVYAYEKKDLASSGPDEIVNSQLEASNSSFASFAQKLVELERVKYDSALNDLQMRILLNDMLRVLHNYKDAIRNSLLEEDDASKNE